MTGRLDRDAARAWLVKQFGLPDLPDEIDDEELDALEACVLPAPCQSIDRAEFVRRYEALPGSDGALDAETVADIASETAWPDDELQRQVDELMGQRYQRQTIDRDELLRAFNRAAVPTWVQKRAADAVLVLLRPADGVTLTHDEARRALDAVVRGGFRTSDPADQAVAARLEAAR